MPELAVERLAAGEPRAEAELEAFFAACPTSVAQQTPGWRNVIASVGSDEPLFLGCRSAGELVGVLPAYRYAGPLGAILVSCAQAGPLGGVACHADAPREAVYQALLGGFVDIAGERGCALATVISNPFWPDVELCARVLEPHYVLENTCQVLDLAQALDAEGRLVSAPDGLRRNLRKAEAGELVVDEEQSAANVEAWYELHAARHGEIGATPLPRALFRAALAHMVPRDKARFFFVRQRATGELAGGGFYVHHGAVMDAFMPSVPAGAARLGAGFLLAWHTIQWARRRGVRFYNWQASPPESGTARFKRQWGSADLHYAYLTRVTGDAGPFLRGGVRAIREGYAWHYALPFDRVGDGAVPERCARSSRDLAWDAAEGTR